MPTKAELEKIIRLQKKQLIKQAKRVGVLEEAIKNTHNVLRDPRDYADMFRVQEALEVLKLVVPKPPKV